MVHIPSQASNDAGALPDHLNQMIRAYIPSRCILTALELDVFTAVGDGASAEEIAARVQANARATAMLLHALVALGLLIKDGERFRNTSESARYFARGSRDNHRDGLLHTADIWQNWSHLTEAVRTGTCAPDARSSSAEWTRNFIAGMQYNAATRASAVVKALGVTDVRRILDLGGGSGIYSIAFAQAAPGLRSEILDLPQVVPLTAAYIEQAGATSQVAIRAGNMLEDDLGSGFDLAMLNAICHMFSPAQNRQLFQRIRRALVSGGRLAVQDFILDPDKSGPLHAALFSLNMLVGTESGASYNELEYTSWMTAAGFIDVRRIKLPGPSDLIVGRVP